MVTINYTPSRTASLNLGRQMENEALAIVFDLSGFIAAYGDGTAVLVHQRPSDAAPYIVNAVQDGTTLTWTVTNKDTAFAGRGEAELRWMVDDVLAKSVVFPTRIKASITADETIPDALRSWYDAMIDHIDTATTLKSEGYAVGKQNGADVGSNSIYYHNNAKYYKEQAANSAYAAADAKTDAIAAKDDAESARDAAADSASEANTSADRAEQAAATAGYMEIDVDETGHLVYRRTDAVDVDFALSAAGHLIMESI